MANASRDEIIDEIKNLKENERVRIRKFTPREVGRLMGVSDDKIDIMLNSGVSNSALYKMFGNSIIVDNMVALFNNIWFPEEEKRTYKPGEQLTLW